MKLISCLVALGASSILFAHDAAHAVMSASEGAGHWLAFHDGLVCLGLIAVAIIGSKIVAGRRAATARQQR